MTIEEVRVEYASYKPWFNAIDQEVVRELPPCECGGRLRFQGFQSGDSRIAVAYCPDCGQAQEF